MSIEKRIERMKKAGIPLPITSINEGSISSVPINSSNADMHSRLQALKRGANKKIIKDMVKSSNKSTNGGFQGIPEPKVGNAPANHPNNQITKGKSIPLKTFTAKSNPELSAIESLYGGTSDVGIANPQSINTTVPTSTQPELSVPQDGIGPSFDPQGMMAKKRAEIKNNSEYIKYAMNPTIQQEETEINQEQFNMKYMEQMMEQIANKTITNVLNGYTEKNKNKLTYENYTKTRDGSQVIKTQDGKLFKLVPVKLKK